MSTATATNTTWVSIRSSQTCPICGSRKGRCGMLVNSDTNEVILYRCKYNTSGKESNGWYIHTVNSSNCAANSNICNIPTTINLDDYKTREIKEEDLILWDKVYRKIRSLMIKFNGSPLYQNHKANLIERGFSEKEIEDLKFFSVPNNEKVIYNNFSCYLKTAIISELKKDFKEEDLINVPGFNLIESKGKKYVSFNNSMFNKESNSFQYLDAYFIPYFNENGLLVGMQYRLTTPVYDEKGKKMRYLWYSSKHVTCGSPIDYYVPSEISIDNVILVSEGAIKTKFAASKLKIRSLAEAGVGNYKSLIKTLQSIEQKENKKYQVLLALDMDKYSNEDVMSAEIRTVTLLKSCGYNVTLLEWDVTEGKGIDDKIFSAGMKGFRYIQI